MVGTKKTYADFTRAVLAFGLAIGVPATSAGDEPGPEAVVIGASSGSVQIAERKRLAADEIRARFVGRTMHRDGQIPARGGGTVRGARYLIVRPDGSIFLKCEWYSKWDDAWTLCPGLKDGDLRNGFTNGVWSIEGNLVCFRSSLREGKGCYAVYDDDGRILFKRDEKKVGVLNGYYEFLKETRLKCIGYLKSGNC